MNRRSGRRVLILANDSTPAAALGVRLEAMGCTTFAASDAATGRACLETFAIDVAIVATPDLQENARLTEVLKAASAPRLLPVVTLADALECAAADASFDLVLPVDAPVRQIATRLESLVRLAIAEEEAQVRAATCLARGGVLDPARPAAAPLQVLTVGEPSGRFLALSHALDQTDVQTVAAFTAYTAFDYLHERAFDAVILWVGASHAEATSISGGMRRNARLHNVPTLLYVRPGVAIDIEQVHARSFSDVMSADVTPEQAAARTRVLAVESRREAAIRRSLDLLGAGLVDPVTGLFPPALFAAHLVEVARALRGRRRPLSVAVLRGGAQPRLDQARADGWFARASPQIDSMVARLVRAADSASRLGPDTVAIAFPGASAQQAVAAAERVAAVIACTAFPAGAGSASFTTQFQIGVAEIDARTSPAAALDRAARAAAAKTAA